MSQTLSALRGWVSPLLIAAALLTGLVVSPMLVPSADAAASDTKTTSKTTSSALTADDLLPSDFGTSTGLGDANIKTTIGNLINVALGFLGIVAVVIILWGGFTWMTAGGSEDKVKNAQRIIAYGAIGLAIILSAWAITNFVIGEFLTATSTSVTE